MSYSIHEERQQIIVATPELELGFSRESGALTILRRPGGASVVGYTSLPLSLDIRLAGGWMSQRFFSRYLSHQIRQQDGATLITLRIGLGPLLISDHYRVTGTLVARSVTLKNVGLDELQLLGVWIAWPGGRVGAAEACRLEVPANGLRPRLPLQSVAQLRRDSPPDPSVAPLARRDSLLESSPDRGPGLLALHSSSEDTNLLCWYFSNEQAAQPAIESEPGGAAVTLGHEVLLAGWLRADEELSAGVQYVMLVDGEWPQAMQAFQNTWPLIGLQALQDVPDWVRQAVIYETHPALHGGFRGLAEALPRLQSLGINLLFLMPIWLYDNPSGQLWDANWAAAGSPYAVIDFERFDPALGEAEDFKALVAQAHRLGMRLVLDLVVQGCSTRSPYIAQHPDWFCRDPRGRLVSSHGWHDTYSFDWSNEDYQAHVLTWSLRLVREFGIDGYRINAPQHKEPNWDRRLRHPASSSSLGIQRLLRRLRCELKQIRPDAVLISELDGPLQVADQPAITGSLPHLMFYAAGLGDISPVELGEWLEDAGKSLPAGVTRICFTESHDTRFTNPLADALHGSRLSRLLLAAMVACGFTPMLWYGQQQGQELFIRRLLQLRRNCRLLGEGKTIYNAIPCDAPHVFSVVRCLDDEWLMCVFNLGPHKRSATLSLPVDRLELQHEEYSLRELIGGRVWNELGRRSWHREDLLRLSITLAPYGLYFFLLLPAGAAQPQMAQQRSERHMRRPQHGRQASRRLRSRPIVR